MAPVEFVRLQLEAGVGALYALDPLPSGAWVGCFLPAVVEPEPPASLSLEAAWANYWGSPIRKVGGGCYVVLAQPPPGNAVAEIANTIEGIVDGGTPYRYLLWLTPSLSGAALEALGAIPFAQSSPESANGSVTGEAAAIHLRTLELRCDMGMTVSFQEPEAAIVLRRAGNATLHLIQSIANPVEVGTVTSTVSPVPLAGALAGGVELAMELRAQAQAGANDLLTLQAGLKYFYPEGERIRSQRFPILGLPVQAGTIACAGTVDPLHPTDEGRTRLTVTSAPTFGCGLRAITGTALTLTPAQGAGFALAPDRVTSRVHEGEQIDSYYAVISGAWSLGFAGQAPGPVLPLLCGLSGLETVDVAPAHGEYAGDSIVFETGKPAFAPRFPPATASLQQPGQKGVGGPWLEGKMTTAWARVVQGSKPPAPNAYKAQANGAPLFKSGATAGFLEHLDTKLSVATPAFPLAVYGEIPAGSPQDAFPAAQVPVFEQSVIAPERRAALVPSPGSPLSAELAAGEEEAHRAATPQGFLVELEQGGKWSSLLLARSREAGEEHSLEFKPVDPKLQATLLTNNLFLVVTAPPWTSGFQSLIDIEGWPFSLETGVKQSFGNYSNVLLFKFCRGKLRDLIADPRRWTDPLDFNPTGENELLAVSVWLQEYVAAAERQPAGEGFEHFNEIVDSDEWRGVLALNVTVPLEELPTQVQALRAGLPSSSFHAHHIGIEITQIDAAGELSLAGSSSLFGLIHYLDPAYAQALASGANPNMPVAPAAGQTYDFKVLRLVVEFANSTVVSFQTKSQVTVNEWFGDHVSEAIGPGGIRVANSIVIDGVLQHHDALPVYVFGSNAETVYELSGGALRYVDVQSTALNVIKVAPPKTGPSEYRFSFAGALGFAAIEGLDALSFGDRERPREGLAFANFSVNLAFDPRAAQPRIFSPSLAQLALDPGQSVARAGSFYGAFPLKLQGLLSGSGSQATPTSQGFTTVSLPGPKLEALGEQWYGVALDLDVGGPGALAAQAGWTATLLLGWSPAQTGDSRPRMQVGMKLPGAGAQANLLSLQGVLKLAVGQIVLTCGGSPPAYLLRLTDIALSLLILRFPPSGGTALYLFGDAGQRTPLAWFAAYKAAESKQARPGLPTPAEVPG